MARNKNRDRLIQTFLSRNRRTPASMSTTPGFRPQKQGTVRPYRPAKRTTKPSRY